jgi:hypothetical protein
LSIGHETFCASDRECFLTRKQGDQIGRIFAQWAIAYFGQWFENYRSSAYFWATFFPQYQLSINFYKKIVWATFSALFQKLIWSSCTESIPITAKFN